MTRLEIPDSLSELRRINYEAYDWYLGSLIPAIDQLIRDNSWALASENPGLELLLQDGSPWPFLLGYATQPNSQFQVVIAGYALNLRPIKGEDMGALNLSCHKMAKTKVEGRSFQIQHPRVGINTEDLDPLTVQYDIEPMMKSWLYQ